MSVIICHKLLVESSESKSSDFFLAITTKEKQIEESLRFVWTCRFVDLTSNRAYSITFSSQELEKASKESAIRKDLTTLADQAFSANTEHEHRFTMVENELIWKKDSGKIKIKLYTFPTQVVDCVQVHKEIFEFSQKKMREEEQAKNMYKENFLKLSEDRKGLLLRVSQMTKDKEKLEEDLYSHFLPILNAKKDKIRELETALSGHDSPKGISQTTVHTVSSSDDEKSDNMDTSQNFLNLSEPLL